MHHFTNAFTLYGRICQNVTADLIQQKPKAKSMSKQTDTATKHTGPRYNLLSAMLIVRQLENLETRHAVFLEIKQKNKVINAVDRIYSMTNSGVIRRLLIIVYMLKCIVALDTKTSDTSRAVAIANFGNEIKTIKRLSKLLPELDISLLTMARKNAFSRGQFREVGRMIMATPRIWRMLGKIVRTNSFMPACRIASVLPYYMRLGRMLDDNPAFSAAIVASNYSPESSALAAAAHNRNRKVIYANHAQIPCKNPFLAPVFADCSVFYGTIVRETYERLSRCHTHATYIGQPENSLGMQLTDTADTIGIFLTALTRKDSLEKLVQQIRQANAATHILIRQHPVSLLETDLSDLVENYDNLQVTIGSPLGDEIAQCDLIICGNSGVALNILGGGRPVAYLSALDDLPFDYMGFVENGLVPTINKWDKDSYASLQSFFGDPNWANIMTNYDASYGRDVQALEQVVRSEILSHLNL
jgi:hypothetical protein